MFSLQETDDDDLVYGTPLTTSHQVETNLISFSGNSNNSYLGQTTRLGFPIRRRETMDESDTRRVMHRDIERKRRQQVSNLYASLETLLPLHQIKRKRSVCDQMEEAANYIKEMQKSIQELRIRRDKLKKLSDLSIIKFESSNDSDDCPNCVTVNLVQDGEEILICLGIKTSEFGLSKILAELQEIKFDVVSCVSTTVNGRFLHNIHIMARDMTGFDVSMLQDRLINAIK